VVAAVFEQETESGGRLAVRYPMPVIHDEGCLRGWCSVRVEVAEFGVSLRAWLRSSDVGCGC
jgi:hypothetical protein